MVDPLTTSAISWGFSAAGWLISPVLSHFLNKCFDALGIDPQFQTRKQILLVKLEKIQTTLLPQLLILTDAAQQSPHRPFLDKWLQKLKSAFYEAEHVLGLVEYRRLEKEVNSLFPSTSKFNLKKLKGKLPEFSSEKKNLIKSLENLEKIVNEAMEFVPLLQLQGSRGNNSTWSSNERYRETISTPGSTVIGRDKDRDHILKLLRQNSSESTSNAKSVMGIWGMGGHIVKLFYEIFSQFVSNAKSYFVTRIWGLSGNLLRENFLESTSNTKSYSVIGIWGMGGSGKTTLAQYVCEHEKAANYFDHIMWVYVSENFNVHVIMRKLWESVSGSSCPNYENLDVLISQLADKLSGKKYLLVLDDVWCDKGVSEQEINQLFAPLRDGKRGSKILVTTRNEGAARALSAMDLMKLPELGDEDFLSLFMSHALCDVKVNEDLEKRLRAIGENIAAKLCRSPLAAKIVAGQLRRRLDLEFWSSMLNRSLLNDTMGALFLSYQHLPPPLQRCFAFCSLFPKGHEFEQDHLVNLLIAEDFIETEHSNEHMKDIANRYFLELISSSFFQVDEWGCYSMHDLIHDLAQDVSEGEYFRIERSEKKEIPAHTRHIYVLGHMLGEYVEKICKLKNLHTIIVPTYWGVILEEVDLDTLFTKLRKLYVVDMKGLDVKRVPKSVVQLRNLRYLEFGRVEEDVPLVLLNRLYQLRTLYVDVSQIPDVGRLILLQNLKEFHVRMERGFELKQLEHLKDLYGSLSIYGLENVKSKEEADRAKLSDKKGLHELLFSWDYQSVDILRDIDVEILDGLCPPPHIKELTIEEYGGKRLPSWILENNDNIIHLQNLLSLTITFLPRLNCWLPLPVNLTKLKISSCLSLAFVLKEDLEMIMSTKGTRISQIVTFGENYNFSYGVFSVDFQFKRVKEMMKLDNHIEEEALSTISKDLNKCLDKRLDLIFLLKDVYGELFLPPALEELSIKSCFITDKILAGSLRGLTSLTKLTLEDIISITCIPKDVLCSLTNLSSLYIRGCLLLTSIGGLDTHSTLEELEINCCPNLTPFETSLVVASSSDTVELTSSSHGKKTRSSILKYVKLWGCMPSDDMLQGLVSVQELYVGNCPTVVNPHLGHLKVLSVLELQDCPNLASLMGLSVLNNLESLEVSGCDRLECYSDADKVPQLKYLCINRFSLLEQLVSRDGFSSLVSLELFEAQQEYFSQEECEVFRYLSFLRKINFGYCKMRSLPNLQGLHSLRNLYIIFCENLSSLPDVPPSVQHIEILGYDEEFTRSCKDPNHPNGQKISHIPDKFIVG